MEGAKKISFGFSKVAKNSGFNKPLKVKAVENVQYIDCLDSKIIVFKKDGCNEDEEMKDKSLIIPLDNSQKIHKVEEEQKRESQSNDINTSQIQEKKADISESGKLGSIEEIAVQEILEGTKKKSEEVNHSNSVLQIIKSRERTKISEESSLEDYESIPVTDYGMAMLRGMGWNPGKGIGKKERVVAPEIPQPRPRGMGLGADKMTIPVSQDEKEDLKVVKGAFVQIVAGSYRGRYGQIGGFNEDSGRVIINLSFQSSTVSINENAFKLVTKEEYDKNSRVLNITTYEEYKHKNDRKPEAERERLNHNNVQHAEKRQRRSLTPTK
ncbi:G-patch domain and KOW motifs-containing protein-like isoform X1 [Periplaneta americana]|uniref:G-patch domain and KOW motifs-containing protein-like isoform X1 n=1 Tax=Periplaneta americana TaxID=6978 RepID=UPI0037E966BA